MTHVTTLNEHEGNGSNTCIDVSMHAQAQLCKRLSPHLSAATPGLRRLFTEPWLPPIARFWERDMGCDALRRGPASAVGFLGRPVLLRAVCFVRAMMGGPVAQEGGAPPARLTKQHEVKENVASAITSEALRRSCKPLNRAQAMKGRVQRGSPQQP